jgi:signal transduction histidine kinase
MASLTHKWGRFTIQRKPEAGIFMPFFNGSCFYSFSLMQRHLQGSSLILWISTVISICVLSIASVFVIKSLERDSDSWQWVIHTREVLERMQIVLASLSEAESAQRGFLLAREDEQLVAYKHATAMIPAEIDTLRGLTSDNPLQQSSIRTFEALILQRLSRLDQVIQLMLNGGTVDASLLETGRQQKRAILERAEAIRAEEQRLLKERQARAEHARRDLGIAIGAVFALSIGLLFLLRILAERDAARLRAESIQLRSAQQHLLEANQLLELRVQQRTEQISEANAELKAFAHTVAHDLRAPLRNVEGFATALLEDETERLSEDGKLFANRIRAAVARMDTLITDLLAYSRLSRSELRLQQVDLGHVMQAVKRDLETQIRDTHAEVTIEEPLPSVLANEGLMVQIMTNLVSNALKFVSSGKAPMVCIYGTDCPDRGICKIFVDDNGIGIDPVYRERIFGVFERLHGQEEYSGTGIGLAIVKKGVERMGGEVKMAGLPEGGTQFEIELPAVRAALR